MIILFVQFIKLKIDHFCCRLFFNSTVSAVYYLIYFFFYYSKRHELEHFVTCVVGICDYSNSAIRFHLV
jgi:hypothetical protein